MFKKIYNKRNYVIKTYTKRINWNIYFKISGY